MFLISRPQIGFYCWITILFFGIGYSLKRPFSLRYIIICIIGTIIGLLLASPQILPTMEFVNISDRFGGMLFKDQVLGIVSFSELPWIIVPLWSNGDILGVPAESISYIGMGSAILILVSFFRHNEKRFYIGFWIISLLALLLSMGENFPLNGYIYQLPGFSYFRAHARWLSIMTFALSILAGYGLDNVLVKVKKDSLQTLLGILIILIVFWDLYFFVRPVVQFVDRKAQEVEPQALPILKKGGRYISMNTTPIFIRELEMNKIPLPKYTEYFSARETLNANLGMKYGLSSIDLYAGLHLRWTRRALSQLTPKSLSEMDCEFVINPSPMPGWGMREVWRNHFFRIYRNEMVKPRVSIAGNLVPDKNKGAISKGCIQGTARILENSTQQEVTVQIESREKGFLILADTYYPGWEAKVNGEQVTISRVNDWMRAVPIPAGESEVNFKYIPYIVYKGLGLAGVGIIIVFLMIIWEHRRKLGKAHLG